MSEIPEVAHLRRALRRLQKGWCQGAFAKDAKGEQCHWLSSEAVCFCSSGALIATRKDGKHQPYKFVYDAAGLVTESIPGWNDSPVRTKEDVIRVFKKAINLARRVRVDQSTT